MTPYELWCKLHHLRYEDYKTNEEQIANVCAAIEEDREAARKQNGPTTIPLG